MTHTEHMYVIT